MKKSSIRKTWNVISSILVALVVLLALLLVKLKAHLDLWHELFEFGSFHSAVGIKQSLTERK